MSELRGVVYKIKRRGGGQNRALWNAAKTGMERGETTFASVFIQPSPQQWRFWDFLFGLGQWESWFWVGVFNQNN